MSVTEKVLDAIQLLATNSVEKAGYDKTIQAQIVSCEDATIGKYRCRYQDAIIYAYSSSSDVTFSKGSYVYILVPGNDMKKDKTILGTTDKLGINYISQAQGDQAYDIIGSNCITSKNTFYLNTVNRNYNYVLYRYNNSGEITLDTTGLNQYIKQSSSLIVGATFKTSIPADRQYRGHYGITYKLRFLDNTSNKEVVRSYTINEDNMIDNPYKLIYGTRQYQIFDIDGSNFIRVESIEIFNKDFPNATGTITNSKLTSGDIQITSLQIYGATRMSNEEINGVAISFFTPQGTFFTSSSTSISYKTITAQVRIKGKIASSSQDIPFYWGIENVGILPNSQYYNKNLGRGWKCLNDSNVVAEATEETDPIIEWIPGKDTYILNFNAATAKNNKIKVAAIYNDTVITKEINIENLSVNVPTLTIQSSNGTKFYYDIGHPTLTCKVNNSQPSNYNYYWAYESEDGSFLELPETTTENSEYAAAVSALNSLKSAIAAGTKFAKAEATNLTNLETNVKAYNFIQRVQKNKVYDVQINNITRSGTFKCSVYNNSNVYLGTASITLTNTLQAQDVYSLVINNGSAVFQYNENGVAPNSKSLDVQQQIQGLSFTIYDNLGQPIDSDILANSRNCSIRWKFPIKNTMLVDQGGNGTDSGTDPTGTYKYYDNVANLIYNIEQKYDIQKQLNQIQLTVRYKNMNLTAETNFTFAKQGEPGTNGTQFLVKLVPNTRMSDPPLWPVVTKAGSSYILNYGLNTTSSQHTIGAGTAYQLFKAQLWNNGQLVWEGASAQTSALDGVTKPSAVNWEVLSNKYNSSASDASAFTVTNATTGMISYSGDHLQSALSTPLANIIKCSITWQNKLYYGTIPITTAWTSSANYRVNLKDYTGFRYAIYTSDGMTPQYDNSHPFEFICLEKINNTWEDVSLVSGSHAITYSVSAVGNVKSPSSGAVSNTNLLEILTNSVYRQNKEKNQWECRPASRYDGICVNTAICCTYTQNGTVVGRINVPIHYLLNKYGLAHINEWDGNSIQLDDQGGFILAPQMGAGKKQNDNSFTGIIMGQVKTAGQSASNTGLFGYASGARTFFLNSENGSALLGKSGNGQIILDPSAQKAFLYSSNYWKSYNTNTGLPANYNTSNQNGQGLLIDLTTPCIKFGNGNFTVNSSGKLTAKQAVINGNITATSLTIQPSALVTGLKSSNISDFDSAVAAKIPDIPDMSNVLYRGDVQMTASSPDPVTGVVKSTFKYKALDGHSQTIETYTSKKDNYMMFEIPKGFIPESPGEEGVNGKNKTGIVISTEGAMVATGAFIYGTIYAYEGCFTGTVYAAAGRIGGFQITDKEIKTKDKIVSDRSDGNITLSTTDFTRYIGKDNPGTQRTNLRFAIGPNFAVKNDGTVYASNVILEGVLTANANSKIGPWNIAATSIWYNKSAYKSENGLYFGTSGLSIHNTFFVDASTGKLTATNAKITGEISATSGTIGATNATKINIGTGTNASIYSGISSLANENNNNGFYIGTDGILLGKDAFKVTSSGTLEIKGKITANSGTIAGFNITSSSNTGTSANGGHLYTYSLYRHSADATYEYEVGIKADGNITTTTTSGNHAFYVRRITKGSTWTSANSTVTFYVTHAGYLYASSATIQGTINATSGNIGPANSSKKIKIGTNVNNPSIYYDKTTLDDYSLDGFYIGTDGISLGKGFFKVTAAGELTAKKGTIGGITIGNGTGIYSNNKTSSSSTNNGFLITNSGAIYIGAYDSNIGSCPFEVSSGGSIIAKSGTIGGFTLKPTTLYSNGHSSWNSEVDGIFLASTGNYSLSVGNKGKFYITKDGVPHCNGSSLYINTPSGSQQSEFSSLIMLYNNTEAGRIRCTSNWGLEMMSSYAITIQKDSNHAIFLGTVIELRNTNTDVSVQNGIVAFSYNYNIQDKIKFQTQKITINKPSAKNTLGIYTINRYFQCRYAVAEKNAGIWVESYGKDQTVDGITTLNSENIKKWLISIDNEGYVTMPIVSDIQATTGGSYLRIYNDRIRKHDSSSRRYKHDIKLLENVMQILNIPVVSFKYNENYLSKDDPRYNKTVPGFIAEDVAKYYPIAAEWENGQIENWNDRYIIPPMLAVEQNHEKRIAQLEQEIRRLKGEI